MNTRMVLTAVAFSLGVAGCVSTPPAPKEESSRCDGPVCHVVVTVTDCTISLMPSDIDVFGHNVQIHWDISSSGYTFPADGIVIKDSYPQGEFSDPRSPNPTKFIWNDKNSFAKTYAYGVKVMRGSTACPPLDPGIINHG